jgi:hypothetical protein
MGSVDGKLAQFVDPPIAVEDGIQGGDPIWLVGPCKGRHP